MPHFVLDDEKKKAVQTIITERQSKVDCPSRTTPNSTYAAIKTPLPHMLLRETKKNATERRQQKTEEKLANKTERLLFEQLVLVNLGKLLPRRHCQSRLHDVIFA